jgi:hypothetical protein
MAKTLIAFDENSFLKNLDIYFEMLRKPEGDFE